jgi:hypothetical protein
MPARSQGGLKAILQVVIESSWVGSNSRERSEVIIRWEDGAFKLNGQSIDGTLMTDLATALSEPVIAEVDTDNFGLTAGWLKQHALEAAQKRAERETDVIPLSGYWSAALPEQKELLIRSLSDHGVVKTALRSIFLKPTFSSQEVVTSATIIFDDGSRTLIESHSAHEYMLPWTIQTGRQITYNANISRALAALMPADATNQAGLAGKDLGDEFEVELANAVMGEIIDKWNLVATEAKVGDTLARLRKNYVIEKADLLEFGSREGISKYGESNLDALLHRAADPPNLSYQMVLPFTEGRVQGLDGFLHAAAGMRVQVMAIPWLKAYIREHAEIPFRIVFAAGKSLSDAPLSYFSTDMQSAGKERLAEEVRGKQAETVLLAVGGLYHQSYWIVMLTSG